MLTKTPVMAAREPQCYCSETITRFSFRGTMMHCLRDSGEMHKTWLNEAPRREACRERALNPAGCRPWSPASLPQYLLCALEGIVQIRPKQIAVCGDEVSWGPTAHECLNSA